MPFLRTMFFSDFVSRSFGFNQHLPDPRLSAGQSAWLGGPGLLGIEQQVTQPLKQNPKSMDEQGILSLTPGLIKLSSSWANVQPLPGEGFCPWGPRSSDSWQLTLELAEGIGLSAALTALPNAAYTSNNCPSGSRLWETMGLLENLRWETSFQLIFVGGAQREFEAIPQKFR